MRTKPKDLGTRYETARVARHWEAGLHAARLTEGGAADLGDLWIVAHPDGDGAEHGWIEEAKARANLNPHLTLHKAIGKAGHRRVLLAHKRLVDKGGKRRVPDGLAEVVSLAPDVAERLLVAHEELRRQHPEFVARLWKE